MVGLDQDARIGLETTIDNILKDAENWDLIFREILRTQGIEANLETVLSLIIGALLGQTVQFYIDKYKRRLNNDETKDFEDILRRRAWELRETFILVRMK